MTRQQISILSSRSLISILLLLICCTASAKKRKTVEVPDSTPFFNGAQVMVDLVGPGQLLFSDYGQFEAALRINLKDRYFPIVELGYGIADHDEVHSSHSSTGYKTKSPYGRIGCDFNILRNKHQPYRAFVGFRYAFTSFKYDVHRTNVIDPIWYTSSDFIYEGNKCNYHWLELLFSIDAKVVGPLHLGWSARYRRRLASNEGPLGNAWYVPGYGVANDSRLGFTFNVILDLLWKAPKKAN